MSSRTAWCAGLLALVVHTAVAAAGGPALNLKLHANAEYRVDTVYINPLELGGTSVTQTMWTNQRLRTNWSVSEADTVELHVQADVLNGVLFGDTGSFGGDPSTNSGVSIATKKPNDTTWKVGLRPGGDPLNPDSYVPVLTKVKPVEVNRAYADVFLPFGLLRVGRQPLSYGANLSSHEGTRINRWGESKFSDSVDRVMFATKLDQIYLTLRDGPQHKLNRSQNDGLFLALFHDWLNQRSIYSLSDDTHQFGAALEFRRPHLFFGRARLDNVFLSAIVIHLLDHRFDSNAWALPLKAQFRLGPLALSAQYMIIRGHTREISEGFAALSHTKALLQDIRSQGAQAIVDYDLGPATATLEFDYASGDDDPRPSTPLTQFSFARDLNVGLLMFEQIMAFETARSAAVGIENLAKLNNPSFPVTEVQSDGRFTNAVALFPQLLVRVVQRPEQQLTWRSGVLFAWPAARGGVVDPIMTTLRADGKTITDDEVNFAGGKPGSYYGTEFDQQVKWTYKQHFIWTVESALLLPGSSLENKYGKAVPSFMINNRFTYLF